LALGACALSRQAATLTATALSQDYPRQHTSVALLEGDSSDDTWVQVQAALRGLEGLGYRSLRAFKKDFGAPRGGHGEGGGVAGGVGGGVDPAVAGGEQRHAMGVQLARRKSLAQVRKWLN
jgi:hypothetical protein